MVDKEKTKKEILKIGNNILKKYNEPFDFDSVAILNTSKGISFMGNFRIYNDNHLKSVLNDLEDKFKKFSRVTVNNKLVNPCCEPPFNHISFEIVFDN